MLLQSGIGRVVSQEFVEFSRINFHGRENHSFVKTRFKMFQLKAAKIEKDLFNLSG